MGRQYRWQKEIEVDPLTNTRIERFHIYAEAGPYEHLAECAALESAKAIVLAVNAHEGLVALLDDVDEYLRANVPSDGWGIRDRGADAEREALRSRISAALEKARTP